MNKACSPLSRPLIVCLCAILCCLLWGSAFPGVKTGFELFNMSPDDAPSSMVFAGLRFTIAGMMIIAFSSIKNKKFVRPSKKALPKVLSISLFQTILQYFFYYIGLAHTSGVKSAVIVGTNVFMVVLMSCLVFRIEKLTVRKLAGCIAGFIGILIINMSSGGFNFNVTLKGEGFMLFSTIVYSISPALMKKFSKDEDVVMISGWQFFIGGVVMAVGGLIAGGRMTGFNLASTSLLIYLSFVSAAAYTLWSLLLKYNPVSKIAVYGSINPIFGVILSAIILGEAKEALSVRTLVALLLVCMGIVIVNRSKSSNNE